MGLKTSQIVKILQLKGLGKKTAIKICDRAQDEVLDSDSELKEFVLGCIANKWVKRLPIFSQNEFAEAFQKGEDICKKSEQSGVRILSIYDNDFPYQLRNIPDNPILLSFRGDYKRLNNLTGIAIIGTREPTPEGINSGEYFGEMLGKEGFNIVSGLAIGCDSAAHRGCLKGRGFTTAILAHGLHTVYPKENKELAEDIVASGGVLLSEYFFGVGALANYFVERDRLQAGLSNATIVIQSGIKGGTMHAVNATIKANKILAAVKYKPDINSDKVKGNEMLINQKKAYSLMSSNLEEFVRLLKNTTIQKTQTANIQGETISIQNKEEEKQRLSKMHSEEESEKRIEQPEVNEPEQSSNKKWGSRKKSKKKGKKDDSSQTKLQL